MEQVGENGFRFEYTNLGQSVLVFVGAHGKIYGNLYLFNPKKKCFNKLDPELNHET